MDDILKITNDPIHGVINLHPIVVKIIDTPQFQRLRNIKQLGGCYFVYPGASHNRFEHSIGVYHLASILASQLQQGIENDIKKLQHLPDYVSKLKNAIMDDNDKLCIEIAGLCHDIGHGPYSHLFDRLFNKEITKKKNSKSWQHEEVSGKMLDHLLEQNRNVEDALKEVFGEKEYRGKVEFIKSLINGKVGDNLLKKYMYEIVANKTTEIDVDKMDYFARDCHGLGMKSNFDHNRFISQCRVMVIEKDEATETTIAVRDKEEYNLYELFHTRVGLFRRAYYHKVNKAIEIMITDALVKADDFIGIKYNGGKDEKKMSEAWDCMPVYEKLTDGIIDYILMSEDENLKDAKCLIKRIYKRDLYKLVLESDPKQAIGDNVVSDVEKCLRSDVTEGEDDFKVQKVTYNYGKGTKNPIMSVHFYKKDADDKCSLGVQPEKVSLFLPSQNFQEELIRVFSKRSEKSHCDTLKRKAEEAFKKHELEELNKRAKRTKTSEPTLMP